MKNTLQFFLQQEQTCTKVPIATRREAIKVGTVLRKTTI